MTDVIRFLESMGSNPALANLSATEYAAAVAALDADQMQKQALLDRDHTALNRLLGGRDKMYCSQYPAREDQPLEPQQEPEPRDDEDKEDPSQKLQKH
jgi:hypothetical protein